MRSRLFTFFLGIAALLAAGLVGVKWITGSLGWVFGVPPTPIGEHLYEGFQPADIHRIVLASDGVTADLVRDGSGWIARRPFVDRADPRFAGAIIEFTLGTKVEDSIPVDQIDENLIGQRAGTTSVRLEYADGRPAAKYIIGRRTPWHARNEETGELIPTVFVRPDDRRRKDRVYACTGDIHPLMRDQFRFLRDHRPFYFNPLALDQVRIRSGGTELTVARETPKAPWRIVKPLELRTDKDAMLNLLQGLYDLTAIRVWDRNDRVVPGTDSADTGKISIRSFGSEEETVLTVYPSAESNSLLATVSDREAVFELPLQATGDLVTLPSLPLTVNALRDQTLVRLNIAALRQIVIAPDGRAPITLRRQTDEPWRVERNGKWEPLHEKQLFSLLKAVTETKVAGFVSDAATDFSPYGLEPPLLRLLFTGVTGETFEFHFGRGSDDQLYARRAGSNTVVRLEDGILAEIGLREQDWRSPILWKLARPDVLAIERHLQERPPLLLKYDSLLEEWTASQGGQDVTLQLNPHRADFLLGRLEALSVTRWLPPGDSQAALALAKPPLQFRVFVRRFNELGEAAGMETITLSIAPVSNSPQNRFYYGRLSTEADLFILDRPIVLDLVTELLTEE